MEELHVIFGSGPVGLGVMHELWRRSKRVRLVNLPGKIQGKLPEGVECIATDAADGEQTRLASKGATVIYQCLDAAEASGWTSPLHKLQSGIMAAVLQTKAKWVLLETLWMYGPTEGSPLHALLPYKAKGPRGQEAAAMARQWQQAHAEGKVRALSGRASDFFGPRVQESVVGEAIFEAAVRGEKATCLLDLDQPHTFCFVPDSAKALVQLGERDRALGRPWHLPGATPVTMQQFLTWAYEAADHPLEVTVLSKNRLRFGGLINSELRKMAEFFYSFEAPYIMENRETECAFGVQATLLKTAINETVKWYQDRE
jgi:nucleoside-diphosphate-sugar epimerase